MSKSQSLSVGLRLCPLLEMLPSEGPRRAAPCSPRKIALLNMHGSTAWSSTHRLCLQHLWSLLIRERIPLIHRYWRLWAWQGNWQLAAGNICPKPAVGPDSLSKTALPASTLAGLRRLLQLGRQLICLSSCYRECLETLLPLLQSRALIPLTQLEWPACCAVHPGVQASRSMCLPEHVARLCKAVNECLPSVLGLLLSAPVTFHNSHTHTCMTVA